MPRFFFDIDDGDHAYRDDEGSNMSGLKAACAEAVGVLPNIARDKLPDGDQREFVCVVRDENDKVVFIARLSLSTERPS